MFWLFFITAFVTYLYVKLANKNKYWISRGIKQGSPVPIFGDKLRAIAHHESLAEMVQKVYSVGPTERYCGAYDFMSPALVLKDPDLIKDILVKDFDHFTDHKRVIPEGSDPIWDKNLFFLTGHKWKDMRSTLTPVFTASKMRQMFVLITNTAKQFVNHFEKKEEDLIEIETKDCFARLANDNIATSVFGFESDSLENKNSKFFQMAQRITDFGGLWQAIRMLGFFLVPKFYKAFKIKILSTEVSNFFYGIVKDNIRIRQEKHITRSDMINHLMEARENHKLIHGVEITEEDVTAQALVFLFAGFDSVSSFMVFMAYELALHPEIQKRLIKEIDHISKDCDGTLTYDAVENMKYLDMVVSETLRKWPITPFVNRVCTIPYTIEAKRPHEHPVHLKENSIVFLPIYGLHHDPKHFPEPHVFNPERFSEENKLKITPYTYLPFGAGPRKCIGYRFALLEIKVLFFYLLSRFEIIKSKKTQVPVKISTKALNMTPEDGLWLALNRRK